jgi:SAM-dependent methyltransferase
MAGEYYSDFYDIIRPGTIQSAEVMVPVVFDLVKPKSVIDVGAGEGHWAKKFRDLGCDVLGIDGAYVVNSPLGDDFVALDIDVIDSLLTLPKADLVVCLEVAEHLPSTRSESFVAEISTLSPTIFWSAAIPRQPGSGHIMCMWPSYWAGLFAQHGFSVSGSIRDKFWDDERIEPWYRQNCLLITKTPELYPDYFPDTTELDRVHPIIRSWWD